MRASGDGRARQGHPEAHRLQERKSERRSVLGAVEVNRWRAGRLARPAGISLLRSGPALLGPDGIEYGIVDGVGSAITADQRRRVGFADAGGKRDLLRQRVGRQVPAVEFAVFAAGENRTCEWIDRSRVDAPFPDRSRKLRE